MTRNQPHLSKRLLGFIRVLVALCFALAIGNGYCASDGFESLSCGADIRLTLVGKRMHNEKLRVLEGRHKKLALKGLGAYEVSNEIVSVFWRICDREFVLLEDKKSIVRAALEVPSHSRAAPAFIGSACTEDQKIIPNTIFAILSNEENVANLTARFAWKIDEQKINFVELRAETVRCPRSGIITADGGM